MKMQQKMNQQKTKQIMTSWLLVFSVAVSGIFLGSSCHPAKINDSAKVEGSSLFELELDYFINNKVQVLEQVTGDLKENFPPDQYNYIFVGQSPTPIYAMMYGQKNTYAIPISGLSHLDNSFYNLYSLLSGQTFYLQKFFAHFDVYLSSLLDNIAKNKAPSNIVVIDYAVTGNSTSNFLNLLNLYMRSKYDKNNTLKNWVNRNGGFPKTSYFMLTSFNIDKIREIRQLMVGLEDRVVDVKEVVPGEIVGTRLVSIKSREYAEKLNFLPSRPLKGIMYPLNSKIHSYLPDLMAGQSFDRFSPYGSWDIYQGTLEKSVPKISQKFLMLRELFKKSLSKKPGKGCWPF